MGERELLQIPECGQEPQSMSICISDIRICKEYSSPPCKY